VQKTLYSGTSRSQWSSNHTSGYHGTKP